jgi:hypothetical protein
MCTRMCPSCHRGGTDIGSAYANGSIDPLCVSGSVLCIKPYGMEVRSERMCPLGHILVPPQMCVCVCVCVCCICDSYEIDT